MKEMIYNFKDGLKKGLRPVTENPRNSEYLVTSTGMIPENGVSRSLDIVVTLPGLASLLESFPFPQVFRLKKHIIICGAGTIWEYIGSNYIVGIGSLVPGTLWSVADFFDYILLTNGKQIVKRDGVSGLWSILSDGLVPVGYTICNLNGQLIVGGPGVVIPTSEEV